MKKLFKKGSSQLILQIVAIAIICGVIYLMYKNDEGFQGSGNNYAAVGIHFNGALSAIYNTFTNTDPTKGPVLRSNSNMQDEFPSKINPFMNELITRPASVLTSFISEYPAFKYNIIQVSTGNIVYDPISEYASKGTMSPFPNTTNVDHYIIYSNLYNMPISAAKALASGLYTTGPTDASIQLSNCSSQSARTNTESIIQAVKSHLYPSNYAELLIAANDYAASKLVLYLVIAHFNNYWEPMTIFKDSEIATPLFSAVFINGLKVAIFQAVRLTGYTDTTCKTPMNLEQTKLQIIAAANYIKNSSDSAAVNAVLLAKRSESLSTIDARITNIADSLAPHIGMLNNITYKSTVYEPCVPFTQGFTNYEGFATSINVDKLYDSNGNKIFNSAPPAPPAKQADKPVEKSSSNTGLYIVAGIATIAVLGGAALMISKEA